MTKTPDPFAVTRPVPRPALTPEQLRAAEKRTFLDEEARWEYEQELRAQAAAEDEENARA